MLQRQDDESGNRDDGQGANNPARFTPNCFSLQHYWPCGGLVEAGLWIASWGQGIRPQRRGHPSASVSYTHLDVYKRQGFERAVARDFVMLDGLGGGQQTGIEGGRSLVLLHDLLALVEDPHDGVTGFAPRRLVDLRNCLLYTSRCV